jgi:hypothetical protein
MDKNTLAHTTWECKHYVSLCKNENAEMGDIALRWYNRSRKAGERSG